MTTSKTVEPPPPPAGRRVEPIVGPFVIAVGSSHDCWFVEDLEGDPGRTLVLTTATTYAFNGATL